MRTSNFAVVACALLLFILPAWAQTPSGGNLTANPVYEKNCAKCHGKSAEGHFLGGPSLVSEKATGMSADDIRNIIANGKGHMPKYGEKLTADEIDTLVQQIKAAGKK